MYETVNIYSYKFVIFCIIWDTVLVCNIQITGEFSDMKTLKLKKWDSAAHLGSEADIVDYLQACFEEAPDDAAFLAKALGTVARARGMTQIAKDVGLGRESLYKALSGDNNPSFATMLKVMSALGMKLQVVAV